MPALKRRLLDSAIRSAGLVGRVGLSHRTAERARLRLVACVAADNSTFATALERGVLACRLVEPRAAAVASRDGALVVLLEPLGEVCRVAAVAACLAPDHPVPKRGADGVPPRWGGLQSCIGLRRCRWRCRRWCRRRLLLLSLRRRHPLAYRPGGFCGVRAAEVLLADGAARQRLLAARACRRLVRRALPAASVLHGRWHGRRHGRRAGGTSCLCAVAVRDERVRAKRAAREDLIWRHQEADGRCRGLRGT